MLFRSVCAERVDDAWRLIAYFKSHARRIHTAIATGPGTGEMRAVKAIVDWIRAGQRASFTAHEFKQARRWVKDDDMAGALAYLTGQHAIRPRPAPKTGPKGGRPPSPSYDVHPALTITQNSQNPQYPGRTGEHAPGFEGFEGFE